MYKRRKTHRVQLGKVKIGGSAPISIQSMVKTDSRDIVGSVAQIKSLEQAGCEIIRVAVKDKVAASSIAALKKRISIPIEADIHFDYRLALLAVSAGADGIRLNPGNINNQKEVREVIDAARHRKIPIRIGVNSGSLPEARNARRTKLPSGVGQARTMVGLVRDYLKIFEKERFRDIMISLKASDTTTTIDAYRMMAGLCDYPFHLGITATGAGEESIIKSAIAIGTLLSEGIGDTIRVSLTAPPVQEVIVAKEILQGLGIRRFHPEILSCPTCGRCQVDLVKIVHDFKNRLSTINYKQSTIRIGSIALMGCEVNGPGEAKTADIGIAFGGGSGIIFKKGKVIQKVGVKEAVDELLYLLKK